jgi:hypothetical protein
MGAVARHALHTGRVPASLADRSVANIVKTYAERTGGDFGGAPVTAYCSGFPTNVAEHRASVWKMMDVSRHKSVDTLRGYVRSAEGFKDHAGAGLP